MNAVTISIAFVDQVSFLYLKPIIKSTIVANNCAPTINGHLLNGAIISMFGLSILVQMIARATSESNDPEYGNRRQPFVREKMPIIPEIIPAKHTNPTDIAIPSFIMGQMKSKISITKHNIESTTKDEAFFHGCKNVKNRKIKPEKKIVIIGKLSVIPIIIETEIRIIAMIARIKVLFLFSFLNSPMK
jgi:hypothetical protein